MAIDGKIRESVGTRTWMWSGHVRSLDSRRASSVQLVFVVPEGGMKPSASRDRCLVRSSSPAYRFALQGANKAVGAQFGSVNPFVVKGTGRPQNPENKPGTDKHTLAVVEYLAERNLIDA